jgi:hypothetical protein
MSLTQDYARRCIPDTVTVFGVRLAPFSLGHWLILERIGSPFATGGEKTPADLAMAIFICSRPASAMLGRLDRGLPLWWRWWAWRLLGVSSVWPVIFSERMYLFTHYIATACKPPRMWCPSDGSRPVTTPELLSMRRAVMDAGYTATEALDCPVGQARIEHAAMLEKESFGKFSFVTDRESEAARINSERVKS